MNKQLATTALLSVLLLSVNSASAANIQMIPPTPIGSTTPCPSGTQQILTYSGAPIENGQAGMNCVPIATDAQGDMAASGYVQMGNTGAACDAGHAGAIRFNSVAGAFQGCNGSNWQALGGGGLTLVVGGCQTSWSGCPSGYQATSYFSPGTYNCCDRCGNPSWKYTVCSQ